MSADRMTEEVPTVKAQYVETNPVNGRTYKMEDVTEDVTEVVTEVSLDDLGEVEDQPQLSVDHMKRFMKMINGKINHLKRQEKRLVKRRVRNTIAKKSRKKNRKK